VVAEPVSARDDILARIRSAVADAPAVDVPRAYRTSGTRRDVVDLFAQRVADYDATVEIVSPDALPDAIARRCGERVVVPPGFALGPPGAIPDDGLGHAELDAMDTAVTGCAVAIAETGTIALDEGRRALTLIPDHHVCLVEAGQIVELVPEAIARLSDAARAGRPITLISGPSATSDIELQRVVGVHGPRHLDVLVVGDSATPGSLLERL
jgi:L-lactate dehydrogenase complex protein LldG